MASPCRSCFFVLNYPSCESLILLLSCMLSPVSYLFFPTPLLLLSPCEMVAVARKFSCHWFPVVYASLFHFTVLCIILVSVRAAGYVFVCLHGMIKFYGTTSGPGLGMSRATVPC
jgi:hypothetical protein